LRPDVLFFFFSTSKECKFSFVAQMRENWIYVIKTLF
jgi:hypothetical protein